MRGQERLAELKALASKPNGIDKLYAALNQAFIRFDKLLIRALLIEAILDTNIERSSHASGHVVEE